MPKSFFRHLGLHVIDLVLASRLGLAPTSLIWYQSLGCLVAMYVLECATVCVRRVGILVPKPGTARGASFWTPPPDAKSFARVCDQSTESQFGVRPHHVCTRL